MKSLEEVIKPPQGLEVLNYQISGSEFGIAKRYTICGDQMGLGKTLQGIIVSLRTESRTIVICPSYLRYGWENEYKKWSKDCPNILVVNTSDIGDSLDIFTVIIVSYSLVAQYPDLLINRDCVLVDEIHYVKNEGTKRWKGVNEYLTKHKPSYFFGMSGTPVTKGILDWYAPLRLLDHCPEKPLSAEDNFTPVAYNGASTAYFFPNYYHFANYFSIRKEKRFFNKKTKKTVKVVAYEGSRNLDKLAKLLKGKYFRRMAKDYITLPEMHFKDVVIDMNVDKELEKAYENGDLDNDTVQTAKAHSAYLKGPTTGKYVKELLENGEGPVLIFTDHINPIERINKELKKYKGACIQGSTDDKIRQQMVDRFQAGELDYLIGTTGSMATGYTITKAKHLVRNDLSWMTHENTQALCRVHRLGLENEVTVHTIIKGAIDARINKVLTKKQLENDKVT